ncbi:MAG: homocysteine biosynthesis protein, partial [Gemmatimonadaceae bacterium]|nr:homocysteine biosynthesis protein [Gloeobacterales cyanobacterium ES-bin-141]
YLGASQSAEGDSNYGGGHVIADLVAGKSVRLRALGHPNDCYPRREFETVITKDTVNQCYLYNPRNVYQNFIVGVNGGERPLYTYLGTLQPRLGNAVYASTGALSPLLNDPLLASVGIGTRLFLGGGVGYVAWEGTQHFPLQKRLPNGTPIGPSATLALIGDLKTMDPRWVRGCRFHKYGPSLMLGVGIALAVLSETVVAGAAVQDSELVAPVIDFAIPRRVRPTFGLVSYAQLKSGQITIQGQRVRTAPLASMYLAGQVAEELKGWILAGRFLLSEPVAPLSQDRLFLAQDQHK